MDLRERLLQIKRYFEEEEKKYTGPDPLKIRCEYISCLERYDREVAADIYFPVLEDTLKQFKEHPSYKQDLRFIQLWINYSSTQPNPIEVMERLHSRGLGTECAILYSSWAELLIKQGLLANADNVFKMGLNNDVKPKGELQKQYEDFLKDIGQKVLLGKITCPKCGSSFKGGPTTSEKEPSSSGSSLEVVIVWEWNPLKVGEKDDFKCPMAYFEDPDPTKKRMYPKDKVYPENGDEFSLEEILAEEYERRYREEEAIQKALAEAKAREEEARRARQEMNELRKKEAEKYNSIQEFNPPVQATIPVVTPQMLNLKPDMDNSLANSTTFTVHTKEAMNVVQDMWSSPAPSDIRPRLYQNEEAQKAPVSTAKKSMPFEIYTEENPPQQTPKQPPFPIYDENTGAKTNNRPVSKPKTPFEIYDENAPPNQGIHPGTRQSALKAKTPFEIYQEHQPPKTPGDNFKIVQDENAEPKCKAQLFVDNDPANDLSEKLEAQAKITPFFNVQAINKRKFESPGSSPLCRKPLRAEEFTPMFCPDKNDDFSDITCNTKAFEFVLPSSTPVALHKKPLHSLQKFEAPQQSTENTRLSVILENSKDKSSNSSSSSVVSAGAKTPKAGPILSTDLVPLEDPDSSIPASRSLYRPSSLYPTALLNTIIEESRNSLTPTGRLSSCNLSISTPNGAYFVQEKILSKTYTLEKSLHISFDSDIELTPVFKKSSSRTKRQDSKSLPAPILRKSSVRPNILVESSKVVIDKENLSPGMLGFPSSIHIERTNFSLPTVSPFRKSLAHVTKDKENIRNGLENNVNQTHLKEAQLMHRSVVSEHTRITRSKLSHQSNSTENTIRIGPTTRNTRSKLSLQSHPTQNTIQNSLTRSTRAKLSLQSNPTQNTILNNPKKSHSKILSSTIGISSKNEAIDLLNTAQIESSEFSSSNFGESTDSPKRSPLRSISNISTELPSGRTSSPINKKLTPSPSLVSSREKKFHKNCIPNYEAPRKTHSKPKNLDVQQETSTLNKPVDTKKARGGRRKKVSENVSAIQISSEIEQDKENIPLSNLRSRNTRSIIKGGEINLEPVCLHENKTKKKSQICNSSNKASSINKKRQTRGKIKEPVPEGFDPFSSAVTDELLAKVGFPKEHHLKNYHVKQTNLPNGTKTLKLGDEAYSILGEIGKGAYAKVLKASNKNNTVALKIEKPPCKWEYYIAKEIQSRVPVKYAPAFMDITAAYIFNNGSVLETHYAKYGTLITNINAFKESTGKSLDLGVVLHYCIELIDIVEFLHKSKIIHADLKPDNIVVREFPAHNESEPCLQLIDFGRCIDMSLLPSDIEFTHEFKTEDNKCIEMKENKPWTYQIDLQGLASIFHCLLVAEYMKVQKKNDRWTLQKLLPRNVRREVWNPIFDSLLNVNPNTDLPFNFAPMRDSLVETFESSLNICLQNLKSYKTVITNAKK